MVRPRGLARRRRLPTCPPPGGGSHLNADLHLSKVRSLWEVLPHQAVDVLIQSAFPGMIRSGEEEFCVERFRHTTVVCELLAVVCGDCVDRDPVGTWQSDRGRAHRLFFLSTRPRNVYFVARSTNDTIAPLCPLPTMVSASQSSSRSFSSTMAGRSEMSTRQGYGPDRHGFGLSCLASCRAVEVSSTNHRQSSDPHE